jgi:hypothetical protein
MPTWKTLKTLKPKLSDSTRPFREISRRTV